MNRKCAEDGEPGCHANAIDIAEQEMWRGCTWAWFARLRSHQASRALQRCACALLAAIGVWLWAMPGAYADTDVCLGSIAYQQAITAQASFNLATAPGTTVTGTYGNTGDFSRWYVCTQTITVNGGAPDANHIYATNVQGIGVAYLFTGTDAATVLANYPPNSRISNNPKLQDTNPNGMWDGHANISGQIIRLPGVPLDKPGVYQITTPSLSYSISNANGTLKQNLSVTIEASCLINSPTITAPFPVVHPPDFAGLGSVGIGSGIAIPIAMTCNGGFPVKAYLTPTAGSTLLSGSRGVISVTGVDNLGIQILAADGVTPFSFDLNHPAVLGDVAEGGNTVSLKAQLLQTRAAPPTLGDFSAGATLTVIYP